MLSQEYHSIRTSFNQYKYRGVYGSGNNVSSGGG